MKLQLCHKWGYQTHIDTVIVVDSITILIDDKVVKNEDGTIMKFPSVSKVYKFLLERAGIPVEEIHTTG